jgi:hypothetical protein
MKALPWGCAVCVARSFSADTALRGDGVLVRAGPPPALSDLAKSDRSVRYYVVSENASRTPG